MEHLLSVLDLEIVEQGIEVILGARRLGKVLCLNVMLCLLRSVVGWRGG